MVILGLVMTGSVIAAVVSITLALLNFSSLFYYVALCSFSLFIASTVVADRLWAYDIRTSKEKPKNEETKP